MDRFGVSAVILLHLAEAALGASGHSSCHVQPCRLFAPAVKDELLGAGEGIFKPVDLLLQCRSFICGETVIHTAGVSYAGHDLHKIFLYMGELVFQSGISQYLCQTDMAVQLINCTKQLNAVV